MFDGVSTSRLASAPTRTPEQGSLHCPLSKWQEEKKQAVPFYSGRELQSLATQLGWAPGRVNVLSAAKSAKVGVSIPRAAARAARESAKNRASPHPDSEAALRGVGAGRATADPHGTGRVVRRGEPSPDFSFSRETPATTKSAFSEGPRRAPRTRSLGC